MSASRKEILEIAARFSEHADQIQKIIASIQKDITVLCPYFSGPSPFDPAFPVEL